MLRKWFAVGIVTLSAGCSSVNGVLSDDVANVQVNNVISTHLNDLEALKIEKKENVVLEIEQGTQRLQGYGIDSRVAVYQLPADASVLKLTLRSYYGTTVFAPSALVIDSNGNLLADIPNSEFDYKPASLLQTFRQEAEKRVSLSELGGFIYVIIYTTEIDQRGKSSIWVRQETSAGTKEVKIQHSDIGRVALEFDALSQSDTIIISENNGLDLKTIDYTTVKIESLFDDLRSRIKSGDSEGALDLVDQIQKL